MLEIKNLSAGYSKSEVLHDISLNCENGTVTTLIGPNGCGKSTLLKSIIGITPFTDGIIDVDGISVADMPENSRAQKVAYLSQGKNIPDITAGRMVLHGRFPYLSYPRKYRKSDYVAAENAMKKMGIAELSDELMTSLSGGMRQKVYIAMALCQEADIILFDEPTTYLDISQQFKLAKILKDLANEGKTVLTVLHDLLLALKISDRIAVMQDGCVKIIGSPQEVLKSGIIPKVFGVDIAVLHNGEETEYFYKQNGV